MQLIPYRCITYIFKEICLRLQGSACTLPQQPLHVICNGESRVQAHGHTYIIVEEQNQIVNSIPAMILHNSIYS